MDYAMVDLSWQSNFLIFESITCAVYGLALLLTVRIVGDSLIV